MSEAVATCIGEIFPDFRRGVFLPDELFSAYFGILGPTGVAIYSYYAYRATGLPIAVPAERLSELLGVKKSTIGCYIAALRSFGLLLSYGIGPHNIGRYGIPLSPPIRGSSVLEGVGGTCPMCTKVIEPSGILTLHAHVVRETEYHICSPCHIALHSPVYTGDSAAVRAHSLAIYTWIGERSSVEAAKGLPLPADSILPVSSSCSYPPASYIPTPFEPKVEFPPYWLSKERDPETVRLLAAFHERFPTIPVTRSLGLAAGSLARNYGFRPRTQGIPNLSPTEKDPWETLVERVESGIYGEPSPYGKRPIPTPDSSKEPEIDFETRERFSVDPDYRDELQKTNKPLFTRLSKEVTIL